MALTNSQINSRIRALHRTISRMNSASNKINNLNSSINELRKLTNDNARVDDKAYRYQTMDAIEKDSSGVKSTITGRIVPNLYYRINRLKKELSD